MRNPNKLPKEIIDLSAFEQILEMDDDDDDGDFSKGIVFDFFEQANQTFVKMDEALVDKDLPQLSSLGHFLKGSSATIGLTRVKDSCEKIQHYGAGTDEKGEKALPAKDCLDLLEVEIAKAKKEVDRADGVLRAFYDE